MPNTSRHPSITDYALLTGLAVIFGSSFIFTGISVSDIPPLTVVWLRLAFALLMLYPILLYRRLKLPKWSPVWLFIAASALAGNVIPFSLITWGQTRVDAGLTAIFMAIMPLATIVLAHVFTTDEKLNRWKVIGVCCGILGIVVLIGPAALKGVGDNLPHQFAILAAAVCYAINAIITRKLVALPKVPMIVALILCATIILTPFCLLLDQPWSIQYSARASLSILALAAGPTAFATWLILVIIDRQGASFLSQINFMVPLFGVFFAAVFLHEVLSVNAWIALLTILLALALSRQGSRADTGNSASAIQSTKID